MFFVYTSGKFLSHTWYYEAAACRVFDFFLDWMAGAENDANWITHLANLFTHLVLQVGAPFFGEFLKQNSWG